MLSRRGRLPGGGRCRSSPTSTGEAAPITRASPGARSRIAARAASAACHPKHMKYVTLLHTFHVQYISNSRGLGTSSNSCVVAALVKFKSEKWR